MVLQSMEKIFMLLDTRIGLETTMMIILGVHFLVTGKIILLMTLKEAPILFLEQVRLMIFELLMGMLLWGE